MRALLQRVQHASVSVDGKVIGSAGKGYMILLGVKVGDSEKEAEFLARKTAELRIFADCKKGRRPAFINSEKPPLANELYEKYVSCLKEAGISNVQTGEFGAHMVIDLVNDGPVTILLDTDEIMPRKGV